MKAVSFGALAAVATLILGIVQLDLHPATMKAFRPLVARVDRMEEAQTCENCIALCISRGGIREECRLECEEFHLCVATGHVH